MLRFLVTWVITAVSLIITANIIPGIDIPTWQTAAVAAIVLGLVNAIVRPLLVFFTLPLTVLTLGLFLFVVNAISFSLAGYFAGVRINSFWDALLGSIVLSLVSGLLSKLFVSED